MRVVDNGQLVSAGPMVSAWHTQSVAAITAALNVRTALGLSAAEAAKRLRAYGPNSLAPEKPRSVFVAIAHQFKSMIVALLVAVFAIALVMGDVAEAVAILVVIVLNALIGFVTEWRAGSALAGLRSQTVAVARVIRDGVERQVPSAELAQGDIVHLDAGDRVPADARLFDYAQLEVDEAALTGESMPASKTTDVVDDVDAAIGDRVNMLHMGTVVTGGRASAIVTTTGVHTEMASVMVVTANRPSGIAAMARETPISTMPRRALLGPSSWSGRRYSPEHRPRIS
jgi:Ca2+-transporting ATPase